MHHARHLAPGPPAIHPAEDPFVPGSRLRHPWLAGATARSGLSKPGQDCCFVAQAAANGPLPLLSSVGWKEKAGPAAIRRMTRISLQGQ